VIFIKLEEKVAIITGAGAGIGEATAFLFAKEGAKVCCNSLSKSALKIADEINESGGEAIFIQADVSKEEGAKEIVIKTIEAFNKIDILFNNAGIVLPGSVETISVEDFDKIMAINTRGVFLVSKYAIPYLKKTRGTIINNASVLALKGVKDRAAYSASKGAVVALTKAMAMDLIDDRVRVNCICPGTVDTPSLAKRLAQFPDPEKARKQFIQRQKLGRLGRPEEIADAVLFLALNEFCTGVILSIDGGMTI